LRRRQTTKRERERERGRGGERETEREGGREGESNFENKKCTVTPTQRGEEEEEVLLTAYNK